MCYGWGEGWRPTLGEWTWCHCWVPLQGAIVVCYGWGKGVVPLQAAIVVCHCSVLWLGGRVTTNFNFGEWPWCHCWVPLQGAIVVCYGAGRGGWRATLAEWTWCHCRVPLQGAIAGCHCSVLWWGKGGLWGNGRGAIAGCHCRVPISVSYLPPIFRATNFKQTPKKTTMNFAWSFLQTLHCSLHW